VWVFIVSKLPQLTLHLSPHLHTRTSMQCIFQNIWKQRRGHSTVYLSPQVFGVTSQPVCLCGVCIAATGGQRVGSSLQDLIEWKLITKIGKWIDPLGLKGGLAPLSRICHMSDFPYSVSELSVKSISEHACLFQWPNEGLSAVWLARPSLKQTPSGSNGVCLVMV